MRRTRGGEAVTAIGTAGTDVEASVASGTAAMMLGTASATGTTPWERPGVTEQQS